MQPLRGGGVERLRGWGLWIRGWGLRITGWAYSEAPIPLTPEAQPLIPKPGSLPARPPLGAFFLGGFGAFGEVEGPDERGVPLQPLEGCGVEMQGWG